MFEQNTGAVDLAGNPTEGNAMADVGIQLRANGDLGYGFGVGFELSGLATLGLEKDYVNAVMQMADTTALTGGAITQAYLTYVMDNTTVKVGRQELPKALSPFAFSETWNVFKNTFEAAVIINSDLPDTTLVGAWVNRNNDIVGPLTTFAKTNGDDGVFMLTAQNKSIEGLTLTGSYYYAANFVDNNAGLAAFVGAATTNPASIVWGDAAYTMGDYYVALQGGSMMSDDLDNNLNAFGGKVGGKFGMFSAEVAYTSVDDGGTATVGGVTAQAVTIQNFGGVKTPLYTQMILNQRVIDNDADTIVAKVSADTEYGKFAIAYDMTTYNASAATTNEYTELDVTYSTKIGESTELFAAYIMQTDDGATFAPNATDDTQSTVRVWARYNF
jgi:hypothetical protein